MLWYGPDYAILTEKETWYQKSSLVLFTIPLFTMISAQLLFSPNLLLLIALSGLPITHDEWVTNIGYVTALYARVWMKHVGFIFL